MYRVYLAMLMLAVMGIGRVQNLTPSTSAQTATMAVREVQASHPIVGAWRWDNDPTNPDTYISYGVFHDDGTYLEVTTGAGTAVGSWKSTGERTVDVTYVFQDLSEDPSVVEPGVNTIRLTAEVDPSGDITLARFTYDARTLDGTILGQGGPYDARGTRVAVEPMTPFDTLVAGTPSS